MKDVITSSPIPRKWYISSTASTFRSSPVLRPRFRPLTGLKCVRASSRASCPHGRCLILFCSHSDIISSRLMSTWIAFGFSLSLIKVAFQRLLTPLFRSVTVAVLFERLTDVVHRKNYSVSTQAFCLDDLFGRFKESSPAETWPKTRFRLVLVFCLSHSHASHPFKELLIDLATEVWNIIIKLRMLIRHWSMLCYQ